MRSQESTVTNRAAAALRLVLGGLILGAAQARAQTPDADRVVDQAVGALCGKRVALLGEPPSHGEAVAFELKARIAQRLIDRCGFRGVLFEAPVYEFVGFERSGASRTRSQLDNGIGRFWWAREIADWRQALVEGARAGRIVIGGLDDQVSATSEYSRAVLPALVAAWASPSAGGDCSAVVDRHLYYRYDSAHPFDEAEHQRLARCARTAADSAAGPRGARDSADRQMLDNFASYVDRQQTPSRGRSRDESLFRNYEWYAARSPSTKWIVWTATVHAARQPRGAAERPLGAWLSSTLGASVGAIGFTPFGGESSRAGGRKTTFSDAPDSSLEARAVGGGAEVAFLDASALRKLGSISSRLLGQFSDRDWAELFDGVIVVRKERVPTFETPR